MIISCTQLCKEDGHWANTQPSIASIMRVAVLGRLVMCHPSSINLEV